MEAELYGAAMLHTVDGINDSVTSGGHGDRQRATYRAHTDAKGYSTASITAVGRDVDHGTWSTTTDKVSTGTSSNSLSVQTSQAYNGQDYNLSDRFSEQMVTLTSIGAVDSSEISNSSWTSLPVGNSTVDNQITTYSEPSSAAAFSLIDLSLICNRSSTEYHPFTSGVQDDSYIFFGGSGLLNCSTFNKTDHSSEEVHYKHPSLGVLLSFFALTTILGNLLVMIAVARERYLRTVTNYFIVSLALADIIIGALVMPFSISMEMTSNYWFFGNDWCDVWHSFDVLASSASILNLSVISLDRYWAITDPIAYPSKMSTGRALVLIALVWICSAAISFPAILWWRSVLTEPLPENQCAFTEDTGYLVFSSIVSFYFPVSIILFAYYKIYKAATEQLRSLKTGSKVMTSNGVNGEAMTLRMHRGGANRECGRENLPYARASAGSDSDPETDMSTTPVHKPYVRPSCGDMPMTDMRPSRVMSRKWKHFAISRKLSKLAKEQKAAKTLGIVMGIFCICWVPFFVTNVLYGICHQECVHHADILFPVFAWLGYINSGMNPVIYACSMRDFRRAFIKIVCCCCPGYHRFLSRRRQYGRSFSTTSLAMSCGERYHNSRL